MNNDLNRMGILWKTKFNSDTAKKSQLLIFSRKLQMIIHPPLLFNENTVLQTSLQKNLGMFLNRKLNFGAHTP